MKRSKVNRLINIVQVVLWLCCLLLPVVTAVSAGGDFNGVKMALQISVRLVGPLCILYFLNYLVLVPEFLYSGKSSGKIWFFVINVLIIAGYNVMTFAMRPVPADVPQAFPPRMFNSMIFAGVLMRLFSQVLVIAVAVCVRSIKRSNDLLLKYEQERRNAAEAELLWLKHQLNPHFLFNTLNNISSLTQIDADKAQESIGQLSDLLRYALYDSEKEFVPLAGEIEFMNNYVDLMKLRCGESTSVECNFESGAPDAKIAPLLFISLIENAFKHGVNARKDSFVRFRLAADGHDLVFESVNSLFEKPKTDDIGSGIGLENLRRRLDLIYPGAYSYDTTVTDDSYSAVVRLKEVL